MEELLTGTIQYFYFSIFFWWANLTFFEFLIFVSASYLLGAFILRLFNIAFENRTENAVYAVILGYGAFGFLGTMLAVFGIFNAFILRTLTAVIFICSYKEIYKLAGSASFPAEFFKKHAVLKSGLIFLVLANFLIAFNPITGIDSLRYHLPIIYDVVNRQEATFSPEIDEYYSFMPAFTEMFYAVPTAIFGEHTEFQKSGGKITVPPATHVFQLLQFSFFVLLLGLFYFFLKEFISNELFILSALYFIAGLFDFQREVLHAGYVEVFTFLFAMASTLLIIKSLKDEKISDKLLLSSVFLGFSLSAKYLAFLFCLINGIFILALMFLKKRRFRDNAVQLLKYGGIPLVLAGFWYAKNFFAYGNPVYPMFSVKDFSDSIAWFVADRTVINLFLFPFIYSGKWFVDATQTSSLLLVFGCFAVFYGLIIFFLICREKIEAHIVMAILFVQLYLWTVFYMSHQQRFLVPAEIMLMAALFMLLEKFMHYFKFEKLVRWVLIASCVILFTGNFHYFGVKFLHLTGFYDRAKYILEIGGQ